jgi:RNA polymerase sigma-70 factor (ECF subfamily)
MGVTGTALVDAAAISDGELLDRLRARDEDAVRVLTQRYSRRLFRIARGILRNDADAEDVVQDTYVRAFTHLDDFRGDAAVGTWLVRIAMNEALQRLRRRRPTVELEPHVPASPRPTPEASMAHDEMRRLLERSIDELPDAFRTIFIARMVEGLSVEETATLFDLRPETVKTRVHRARARLRASLARSLGPAVTASFAFDGPRCARVTDTVLMRLRVAWTDSGT